MNNLQTHHIGIVVKDIDEYIKKSIFPSFRKFVYDPIQDANLALIDIKNDISIELIQPISELSTTYNFLKNYGGGFHHICFMIKNFSELEKIIDNKKIKIFWGPKPAILFNNKNVVFGYTQNKEILEFLIND